jgi:hypothetical protein
MGLKDDDPDRAEGWRPRLTWTALFLLGLLLYELTSQPGLAAAVTCIKFGWSDFQVARWLRRVDPDRGRGRVCFWFYLAFGLWKVAILATVMMITLLFVASLLHPGRRRLGGPVLLPVLAGTFIAAGIGFGLSFWATYVALWSALKHRVKVWLGFAPHRARKERFWPPCHGRTNAAPFVTVTTLILTLWAFLLALLLLVTVAGRFQIVFLVLLLAGVFLAFPGFVFVFRLLDRCVFAQSPHECWAAADGEAAYETGDGEALY